MLDKNQMNKHSIMSVFHYEVRKRVIPGFLETAVDYVWEAKLTLKCWDLNLMRISATYMLSFRKCRKMIAAIIEDRIGLGLAGCVLREFKSLKHRSLMCDPKSQVLWLNVGCG